MTAFGFYYAKVSMAGWLMAARVAARQATAVTVLTVSTLALAACVEGKHPFLMTQACLGDAQGLVRFTEQLQSIARAEGMAFGDRSAETKAELNDIARTAPHLAQEGPVINISLWRGDGMGVSAGNLGMNSYQVVLGFTEGARPAEARAFADRVIDKLDDEWDLRAVHEGEGAHPLPDCS